MFLVLGCRNKFHKEHITPGNGEGVAPCKVNYDPTTAKEMLLMASTLEEQQLWVARLLKRIQKSGYKAAGGVGDVSIVGPVSRVSPHESLRSSTKPPSAAAVAAKSATLPGNASLSKK